MGSRRTREQVEAALFARRQVDNVTGCWNWTGPKTERGYGWLHALGWGRRCHRISAVLYLGLKINDGRHVLHRCDNPACFNPRHLFLGSQMENIHDMIYKGRKASTSGALHGMSKLKESDVLGIRMAVSSGRMQKDVARDYNISRPTVCMIVSRKLWPSLGVQ